MDAVIICIGDEILSGDITDLNSTWLAKNLTELGTVVKRIEVIPDDVAVIVVRSETLRTIWSSSPAAWARPTTT